MAKRNRLQYKWINLPSHQLRIHHQRKRGRHDCHPWPVVIPQDVLPISPEASNLIRTRIGFRTETAYGEGYRDAKSVIQHEIEELGNLGEQSEIAQRLGLSKNATLAEIGSEIDKRFGSDAKVLWLATKEGVKYYLDNGRIEDVDKYKIPENALLIIDLGYDGQLFVMNKADYEKTGNAARSRSTIIDTMIHRFNFCLIESD